MKLVIRSLAALLLSLLLAAPARAQGAAAEQAVHLVKGWNAVWLEVQPTYPDGHAKAGQPMAPADVFLDVPPAKVLAVISPKPLSGTAEFFAEDPGNVGTFNQAGWEQWHKPAAVGDNLTLVTGNRPYLIEVSAAMNLKVEGRVRFHRPAWRPDRYNLLGFGLEGTPTFQDFFDPSGGKHPVDRIFRLDPATGNWKSVSGSDRMASNEAYWIFSSGPSDYMGPVAVTFDDAVAGRLHFGGPSDAVTVDEGPNAMELDLDELIFTNLGSTAATPELELVANRHATAGHPGDLQLYAVRPTEGTLGYQTVVQVDATPDDSNSPGLGESAPPQATAILTLGARRNWSSGLAGRTNLYRLKTGAGTEFWLPVTALNNDLQLPTAPLKNGPGAVAGLWVGEVSVTAATSIVVENTPVQPTAAPAPLRLLLHSDSGGVVRLLSQVTMMQTRSADPEVPPVPVLVVDRNKIPFFEGIRERNGKRVGVRLEAIAFDMPRDTSVSAQGEDPDDPDTDDLIDMIVAESTSPNSNWFNGKTGDPLEPRYPDRDSVIEDLEDAIDSYLQFRGTRPPALREIYQLSLPMSGTIGAGETVETNPGTLVLDPFHRSNPFRHAFHQRHPKGPKITRELTIVFDSEQPIPDRLRGTFTETVEGLTNRELTATGTIQLSRVSAVDTLD